MSLVRILVAGTLSMGACGGPDTPEEEANSFQDVPESSLYGDMAADVTLEKLNGSTITIAELHRGENNLVFLNYIPNNYHDQLWANDVYRLFEGDKNVHFIFTSALATPDQRRAQLEGMRGQVDGIFAQLPEEERTAWQSRVHFVINGDTERGWTGQVGSPNIRRTDAYHSGYRNIGFLVDQKQQIRPIGELLDWLVSRPSLGFIANELQYLNWEHDRDMALEAEDALEVTLWEQEASGTGWGGDAIFTEADIPDLAEYDKLYLDLHMGCYAVEEDAEDGSKYSGDLDCPEWDRLTHLYLCAEDDPESCDEELGRWVTPYTKDGRWVHDVTPMLARFKDGGSRRFRYKAIDNHWITLKLRAVKTGESDLRPTAMIPLYRGGTLTALSNERYEPMDVEIPAGAKKVELAAVISGHSFGKESLNCAEFCNHEHHFTIGNSVFTEDHPIATSRTGCVEQIADGVVPNQFGSWQYGRAGWCPGQEVGMWRVDVTNEVSAGGTVTVDYEATVNGQPFQPRWFDPSWDQTGTPVYWDGEGEHPEGIWVPEVNMRSWLVIYE